MEQIQIFEGSVKFKTCSGETIRTQGQVVVPINYEAQWFKFTMHITEGINQIYCRETVYQNYVLNAANYFL